MMAELIAAKAAIRQEVLASRAAVSDAQRQSWSAAIVARIATAPVFTEAPVFCSYVPMPEEIQVQALALDAARRGCRVLLPAFDDTARVYRWRFWDVARPLRPGHWDIPEPEGRAFDEPSGRICILVPGLAFDPQGNRIGYGAGYYDRLLQTARAHPANGVSAVGAAFPFQLFTALPTGPHDQPLDVLATPDHWYACRADAGQHFHHDLKQENTNKGE